MVIEVGFGQRGGLFGIFANAMINQHTLLLGDRLNTQTPAFLRFDHFTFGKCQTGEWRIGFGVNAAFFGGRIQHFYGTEIYANNRAQAQFCFGVTQPALTNGKLCVGTHIKLLRDNRGAYCTDPRLSCLAQYSNQLQSCRT